MQGDLVVLVLARAQLILLNDIIAGIGKGGVRGIRREIDRSARCGGQARHRAHHRRRVARGRCRGTDAVGQREHRTPVCDIAVCPAVGQVRAERPITDLVFDVESQVDTVVFAVANVGKGLDIGRYRKGNQRIALDTGPRAGVTAVGVWRGVTKLNARLAVREQRINSAVLGAAHLARRPHRIEHNLGMFTGRPLQGAAHGQALALFQEDFRICGEGRERRVGVRITQAIAIGVNRRIEGPAENGSVGESKGIAEIFADAALRVAHRQQRAPIAIVGPTGQSGKRWIRFFRKISVPAANGCRYGGA